MDQFAVDDELGNGSFGAVFKARHKESGEVVGVKQITQLAMEKGGGGGEAVPCA